jgi:hypothetical protein
VNSFRRRFTISVVEIDLVALFLRLSVYVVFELTPSMAIELISYGSGDQDLVHLRDAAECSAKSWCVASPLQRNSRQRFCNKAPSCIRPGDLLVATSRSNETSTFS